MSCALWNKIISVSVTTITRHFEPALRIRLFANAAPVHDRLVLPSRCEFPPISFRNLFALRKAECYLGLFIRILITLHCCLIAYTSQSNNPKERHSSNKARYRANERVASVRAIERASERSKQQAIDRPPAPMSLQRVLQKLINDAASFWRHCEDVMTSWPLSLVAVVAFVLTLNKLNEYNYSSQRESCFLKTKTASRAASQGD